MPGTLLPKYKAKKEHEAGDQSLKNQTSEKEKPLGGIIEEEAGLTIPTNSSAHQKVGKENSVERTKGHR